jgi:hypothetical protein
MSQTKENFIEQMEKMPKVDLLAIAALGLNIFVIYQLANLASYQELLEPAASHEIMVIQLSAVMAVIFVAEYFGDKESSSNTRLTSHSSDNSEGFMAFLGGLAEGSKVVDAAVIGVVFLGYQYVSQNAGYSTSMTEISSNPEVLAMQFSVLMMANFGIDLLVKLIK